MRPAYTMGPRLHLPVHRWRTNRHCPSQLLTRYRPARHLLRSSTLPLRPINRSCICHSSWLHSLIPPIHRVYSSLNMGQNSLWRNVRRRKSNLLPSTLPRPSRHATTIFRLPRCLHNVKHYFFNWLPYLPDSRNHISLHYLRGLRIKT